MSRGRVDDDQGTTLIEVMVSLAILAVMGAIFTTGVVGMHRVANRHEAVSTAQTQLHLAMLRLDKEIRYAEEISRDGRVGDDWHVEYKVRNMHTRALDCVGLRLRVGTGRLERRAWVPDTSPVNSPWHPLAQDLAPSAQLTPGESPLGRLEADANATFQRLRVRIAAAPRGEAAASARQTDVSFTALNTSAITSSDTVCSEGRSA